MNKKKKHSKWNKIKVNNLSKSREIGGMRVKNMNWMLLYAQTEYTQLLSTFYPLSCDTMEASKRDDSYGIAAAAAMLLATFRFKSKKNSSAMNDIFKFATSRKRRLGIFHIYTSNEGKLRQ